jgi:hypothetical protein
MFVSSKTRITVFVEHFGVRLIGESPGYPDRHEPRRFIDSESRLLFTNCSLTSSENQLVGDLTQNLLQCLVSVTCRLGPSAEWWSVLNLTERLGIVPRRLMIKTDARWKMSWRTSDLLLREIERTRCRQANSSRAGIGSASGSTDLERSHRESSANRRYHNAPFASTAIHGCGATSGSIAHPPIWQLSNRP